MYKTALQPFEWKIIVSHWMDFPKTNLRLSAKWISPPVSWKLSTDRSIYTRSFQLKTSSVGLHQVWQGHSDKQEDTCAGYETCWCRQTELLTPVSITRYINRLTPNRNTHAAARHGKLKMCDFKSLVNKSSSCFQFFFFGAKLNWTRPGDIAVSNTKIWYEIDIDLPA